MKWSEKQKDWMQEQIERDIAYKLAYQETGEPTMTEYVRVRKDEYDKLLKIRAEFYSSKSKYVKDSIEPLRTWYSCEDNFKDSKKYIDKNAEMVYEKINEIIERLG